MYKNGSNIIKFDDTENEEYKFHQHKNPISINDIDINEIAVFNKFHFGKQDFKYFIAYKDDRKIRPLCISFPKLGKYRSFGKTKYIYFLIKEESF